MSDTDDRTIPEGLWQRQFDTELDFPATPPTRPLALCTTPRCGSHFLGHLLHATGAFGYPLEYFNPGNWQVWGQRAGKADRLDYVKSVRTGPNGVFATKLHHEHLTRFLEFEPDPLSYRFVHLRRRDLLKQAISFARAQQTGAWISDMPALAEAQYDHALITAKMEAISQGNAGWSSFLGALGIKPLELYYEDIAADPDAAIAGVAAHLGVGLPDIMGKPAAFTPQRQKRTGDDWEARFLDETRTRLARGEALPGTPKPAHGGIRRLVRQGLSGLRAHQA